MSPLESLITSFNGRPPSELEEIPALPPLDELAHEAEVQLNNGQTPESESDGYWS